MRCPWSRDEAAQRADGADGRLALAAWLRPERPIHRVEKWDIGADTAQYAPDDAHEVIVVRFLRESLKADQGQLQARPSRR
jgi:hypothetical protein